MILVASQRGGPKALAAHLLNANDNDHVTVRELRGFVANDLPGAMLEVAAIARGTKCTQPLFSLSFNPPKEAEASIGAIMEAVERAETTLGLTGQPRAIVIHEKNARRHAHVVWSRIDGQEMRAINMPFFKTRLAALSKELFLENGWELPEGHRTNGWKNPLNFTLAEWQQAKRHDLDPREIKQVFRNAWERSDGLAGFGQALEEHGYYLAKGDRRSIVATDLHGEVYSVSRWTGLKSKDVAARLGQGEGLPHGLRRSGGPQRTDYAAPSRPYERGSGQQARATHAHAGAIAGPGAAAEVRARPARPETGTTPERRSQNTRRAVPARPWRDRGCLERTASSSDSRTNGKPFRAGCETACSGKSFTGRR